MLLEFLAHVEKHLSPFAQSDSLHSFKATVGRFYRGPGFFFGSCWKLGDDFSGGWIDSLMDLGGGRIHPLTVDQQFEFSVMRLDLRYQSHSYLLFAFNLYRSFQGLNGYLILDSA